MLRTVELRAVALRAVALATTALLTQVTACGSFQREAAPCAVARIDDGKTTELIACGVFRARWGRIAREGGLPAGTEERLQLARSVVRELVEARLIANAAHAAQFEVPEGLVDARIEQTRVAHESADALTEALIRAGLTDREFRDAVEEEVVARRFIAARVHPRVAVIDQEIRAAFEAEKEGLHEPESARVRILVNESVEGAERMRMRVLRGESVLDIYRDAMAGDAAYATPRRDPTLHVFKRGTMPSEVEEFVFSHAAGAVSPVLTTEHGNLVIKVEARIPSRTLSLSEAALGIESRLLEAKRRGAERAFLAQLHAGLTVAIDDRALADMIR